MQTSFMRPAHLSICREILTHPVQWTIVEPQIKKSIHDHASFRYVHERSNFCYCVNFSTSFLQISVIFFSNVSLMSNLTTSNLSHSLLFMSY